MTDDFSGAQPDGSGEGKPARKRKKPAAPKAATPPPPANENGKDLPSLAGILGKAKQKFDEASANAAQGGDLKDTLKKGMEVAKKHPSITAGVGAFLATGFNPIAGAIAAAASTETGKKVIKDLSQEVIKTGKDVIGVVQKRREDAKNQRELEEIEKKARELRKKLGQDKDGQAPG